MYGATYTKIVISGHVATYCISYWAHNKYCRVLFCSAYIFFDTLVFVVSVSENLSQRVKVIGCDVYRQKFQARIKLVTIQPVKLLASSIRKPKTRQKVSFGYKKCIYFSISICGQTFVCWIMHAGMCTKCLMLSCVCLVSLLLQVQSIIATDTL